MGEDVRRFYEAAMSGGTFDGQLGEDFQAALGRSFGEVRREDCDWYHTMDFGPGDVVQGVWDLRGRERSYLGFVNVAEQRVLEIGPATGHLTRYMEKQGGDVVAFDVTPGVATDIIPQVGHDLDAHRRLNTAYAERVRNSWWYGHSKFKSGSKAVYGDIYSLPKDLGRFDVSLLASVLLHVANPFRVLEQTATLTDRAVVVTEPVRRIPDTEGRAVMEFSPVDTTKTVVVWWSLTPQAIVRMLQVLGFLEFSVYFHRQSHHVHHDLGRPAEESLYFTVVAERHKGWARRHVRSAAEEQEELAVKRQWAPESPVKALEAELLGMRSSLSWRITRPARMLASLLRRFYS